VRAVACRLFPLFATYTWTDEEKRKRETEHAQAKEYFEELERRTKRTKSADETNNIAIRLPPKFITASLRFDICDGEVVLIDRKEIYQKLRDFLETYPHQPLYIHGPQGVGKSHLLLRCVNDLRQDFTKRVVYVPGMT
jgi:DNA replication protein DnaC